jgi:RsiW-degrading membrane proteinase PrsW (M82 family)
VDRRQGVESTEAASDDATHWEATGEEPALRWTGRTDLPTFESIYRERLSNTTDSSRWIAVGLATVVAGPFAILGALLGAGGTASFAILVVVIAFGPLAEEVLKASGALYLAEQRPWLIPAGWVLPFVTLAAGLVFAAIENLVYLNIYIADPSQEIIRWRWIAGPVLHGATSFIAGLGVRRMWMITNREHRVPRVRHAAPYLIAAVLVHGLYNLTVTLLEVSDVIF